MTHAREKDKRKIIRDVTRNGSNGMIPNPLTVVSGGGGCLVCCVNPLTNMMVNRSGAAPWSGNVCSVGNGLEWHGDIHMTAHW